MHSVSPSWVRRLGLSLLPLVLASCGAADGAPESAAVSVENLSFSGVSFQTVLGGTFVGAQSNGGGAVIATATAAQAWEKLTLLDSNGGSLESGDSVFIQAGNGQFFQALNGGGTTLNAGSNNQLSWETFKVVKQSGSGVINNGDVIGLQASTGSWVSAQNGGGGSVFAYGGALGSWEQLKVSGLPVAAAPPAPPPASSSMPVMPVKAVTFKTQLNGNFVGAQNNGGGAVIATATVAQAWETFSLIDINGGTLNSGDSVFIQAGNGQFFQALNGGGSTLNAGSNNELGWETFKLVKQAGSGAINSGDVVGLQASSGAWVSAANGGGGTVFAYGGAFGSWEGLVISISGANGSNGGSGGSGGSSMSGAGGAGGGTTDQPSAGAPGASGDSPGGGVARMPTHVACVGDSITEGFAASSAAKAYPAVLQGLFGPGVQVHNFGHSGTTMLSDGFGDAPYEDVYEYQAAQNFVSNAGANAVVDVIIMLGANDSKPFNWTPTGKPKNDQQYLKDYRAMVEKFLSLTPKPVVYLALPLATGSMPCCQINGAVIHDEEIPLIQQLAAEQKLPTIDLNTPTTGHPEYFGDGVHPTDSTYALVAQLMYNGLLRAPRLAQ